MLLFTPAAAAAAAAAHGEGEIGHYGGGGRTVYHTVTFYTSLSC